MAASRCASYVDRLTAQHERRLPTLPEAIREAALMLGGEAIDI